MANLSQNDIFVANMLFYCTRSTVVCYQKFGATPVRVTVVRYSIAYYIRERLYCLNIFWTCIPESKQAEIQNTCTCVCVILRKFMTVVSVVLTSSHHNTLEHPVSTTVSFELLYIIRLEGDYCNEGLCAKK